MTATALVSFRLNFFPPRERTCACHEERASHSLVRNGVGDVMIHVTDKLEESHWLIIFQSKARASLSNSKIDRDISKWRRKRRDIVWGTAFSVKSNRDLFWRKKELSREFTPHPHPPTNKKQQQQQKLTERGFDPRTSGLWAQHASTAPLCCLSNQRETYGSNVRSGRTTDFLARVQELCESRGGRPGQTPLKHWFTTSFLQLEAGARKRCSECASWAHGPS